MPRKADAPTDRPPEFSIEDTAAARIRVQKDDPQPYAVFEGKRTAKEKRTDLRKLNEWIKAQRRAEDAQRVPESACERFVLFMPLGNLKALIVSALRKFAARK
jgi:hypothetical protein